MKKNIDLIIDGVAPEKVMYDTDNHSLVVLYPEQKEFKKGDKVRLKKNLNLKLGEWYNDAVYCKQMDDMKDAILTIARVNEFNGNIKAYNNIDGDWWMYRPEWLEHVVEDEVKFKRGDILASDDILLIFDKYKIFNQEKDLFHSIWNNIGGPNNYWISKYFTYATDEQKAQLHKELRYEGKKWNAETLEIEEVVPEFKKGDILASKNFLLIFDEYINENRKHMFDSLWNSIGASNRYWVSKCCTHATDEQKAQVHELLKKEGKKWDAETLQVENLDINEIVYNLSSACSYLNKPVPDFKSLLLTISNEDFHKYKAQITLQLIREAWNKSDGFEADWADSSQQKFSTGFSLDEGEFQVYYVAHVYELVDSQIANFSFKSEERARQFGNQFIDLFKIALGF